MQEMRTRAACGAGLLDSEAADRIAAAVLGLRDNCGGFRGLNGEPDVYYSLFATFILEALQREFDDQALLRWVADEYAGLSGVERVCAELILARQGKRAAGVSRSRWIQSALFLGSSDSYKLFLSAFLLELYAPRWMSRVLIRVAAQRVLKKRVGALDFNKFSTPGAIVRALLAEEVGAIEVAETMWTLIGQRHRSSGGYVSAPNADADLLATAVVLFGAVYAGKSVGVATKHDRFFIEMCWQQDGFFSAAPDQSVGDIEHTYYGLLALGCC